mgnify:CR=1 FL=1
MNRLEVQGRIAGRPIITLPFGGHARQIPAAIGERRHVDGGHRGDAGSDGELRDDLIEKLPVALAAGIGVRGQVQIDQHQALVGDAEIDSPQVEKRPHQHARR